MCRSRRELSNAYLLEKIGVDTAENEPLEVWGKNSIHYSLHSLSSGRTSTPTTPVKSRFRDTRWPVAEIGACRKDSYCVSGPRPSVFTQIYDPPETISEHLTQRMFQLQTYKRSLTLTLNDIQIGLCEQFRSTDPNQTRWSICFSQIKKSFKHDELRVGAMVHRGTGPASVIAT